MVAEDKYLKLGEVKYNLTFLKGCAESYAISVLVKGGHDENQVRNAWKRANGLSVRKYEEKKPPRKRVKKSED